MKSFSTGVRVRALARTITGWMGTGTYISDGQILMDGRSDLLRGSADFERDQLARMKDQTPNPEHAAALAALPQHLREVA